MKVFDSKTHKFLFLSLFAIWIIDFITTIWAVTKPEIEESFFIATFMIENFGFLGLFIFGFIFFYLFSLFYGRLVDSIDKDDGTGKYFKWGAIVFFYIWELYWIINNINLALMY